jgi:hypothetical protein
MRFTQGQTVYAMRSNQVATLAVIGFQHTEVPEGVSDTYLCRDAEDGLVRWYPDGELHPSKKALLEALA